MRERYSAKSPEAVLLLPHNSLPPKQAVPQLENRNIGGRASQAWKRSLDRQRQIGVRGGARPSRHRYTESNSVARTFPIGRVRKSDPRRQILRRNLEAARPI